jgi:membrane-associated protease RseP (regulator of RpoE activity)
MNAFSMAVLAMGFLLPIGSNAQPEGRRYVFFGDEGGGSYLGVDTRNITQERVSQLHLKEESGVEITMVDQDALAGKAGLKEQDVITSINGEKIESEEQLSRVIHEIPAGRTIAIGIVRDGQPMTLKAQLAERSTDRSFHFNMPPVNVPAIHIPPITMPEIDVPSIVVIHAPRSSGMMVENLTPQLGEFFGVKGGSGVLIRSVEKGSRAEQAGFRAGDVIVKVNGAAVSDCSDFSRLLHERKENKATVGIIRDHHEQTLTLALPEPRRSGSIEGCDWVDSVTCAEFVDQGSRLAKMIPEIRTAEMKRLAPEMEKLKKQFEEDVRTHQGEVRKDLEQMKRGLGREREEMRRQMKEWVKQSEI